MTGPSRRTVLGAAGGGLALGVTATRLTTSEPASASTAGSTSADRTLAFAGVHQQGVVTPPQQHAAFLACDVTAVSRAGLESLLRTLTTQIRQLTAGGGAPDRGPVATAADDGVLGPEAPAGGLSVTVAVGASLFDHRYGLAAQRPARLTAMPAFPDDRLQPERCGGDLMIQVCADAVDVVVHAVRSLLRATRGTMQVRWRRDGFISAPRPSGSPRNLLGFKDGSANPSVTDDAAMDAVVWTRVGGEEPAWVAGGTYQVVREIRMLVEFWDRVSVREQNAIIGRDKDTGAPLSGSQESDPPDYTGQNGGGAIRLDAHIRRASDSGSATSQRLLRRGYNYDGGVDANGDLDMGLLFCCFNADLERQFAAVQRRLAGEPLVDYVVPVGGGYFFVLPGAQDDHDWLGRGLLAAVE